MENYDEHDKNYGALVNSISVAMVDKTRGILMDLPKTMPRLQYKNQTSGLIDVYKRQSSDRTKRAVLW